ncbi:MAG: TolC family outer membrane protein [Gammaproteobacteria bacterium]|nr:TolC family outer membrane protein [Gammaproteobacteria bacterium]
MNRLMQPAMLMLALFSMPSLAATQDLLDVYRLAQVEDRVLRAAAAELEAAREAIPQARARYLPSVTAGLEGSRTRQDREGGNTETFNSRELSLRLEQPVFDRAAWLARGQADKRVQQAEVSYTAVEQELIVRTATAYFGVLDALADLRAVLADKEATARQLDQTQQRFEVGLIAITDVHEAQARYDRVLSEEILSRNRLDSARERLRVIIGRSQGDLADLAEEVALVEPEPADLEAWVDRAAGDNLALLAARYGLDVARDEIEVRRSGHYPTLDLVASYGDSETEGGAFSGGLTGVAGRDVETESASIGLRLSVPIYLGGQVSSLTREAEAQLVQASELYEQQSREVERQTRDAYRNVIASIARVRALAQTVVSTQSALDATQAGFEVGTRTIVDVLDSQRNLFLAQRDYDVARHAYVLSTLNLKQAVGTLDEGDVEEANRLLE